MTRFVLACATALLLAAPTASAQTEAPAPAPPPPAPAAQAEPSPDSAGGGADTVAPDAASTAEAEAQQALEPGIEVSLGRPEVKEQVAQAMGVTTVDVPLTIRVPLEVARQVCGETVFDSTTDTNRSCTATRFAPALVEAARAGLMTEANELRLEQPAQ